MVLTKNKKGQITLEMALLVIAMVAMVKFFQRAPFMQGIFEDFLISPWKQVRVMMESGVWGETDAVKGRKKHPSWRNRLYATEGEKP